MSNARRLLLLAVVPFAACGEKSTGSAAPAPPIPIVFEEITDARVPAVAQTDYFPHDGFNSGLGVAIGDVDGDGRPDVYLAGGGLYLNRPDATGFRLEAAPSQTPSSDPALYAVSFGDFDRDGDLDLALAGRGGVKLWANDGAGRFVDVTLAAGVAGAQDDVSLSVAWGDVDGDGYLDLAVANYGFPTKPNDAQASRLYLNRRDGSFTELLSPLAGLDVRAWVATFADFDGDGRLDLHLGDDLDVPFLDSSKLRHDLVLLNHGLDDAGHPALVESSQALGLSTGRATMGCAVGNADRGPGWDVLVADVHASWLFRSSAGGERYKDATASSGIDLSGPKGEEWWQWGSVFVDLDGDGFEDALVAQSPIHPGQTGTDEVGPVLLRNHGGTFELVRYAFGGPMNARAVALVDLDGDGDEDAIVAPFFGSFRFFVNETAPRNFLRVQLEPTVSAPGAAGAVVVAASGGVSQKRMRVAGGQPHSSGSEIVDFGLGPALAADLTVTWPSGAVQKLAGAAAGHVVVLTEPRFVTVSDPHAPADGSTHVTLTVDLAAAGLGGAGASVRWSAAGVSLDATADSAGVATFDLPPRSTPGSVLGVVTVDGRELPVHPAIDYH